MIVVADTSPLNYLIQIQCDHVLPRLYQTVVVPAGVIEELRSPKAPTMVKVWMDDLLPGLKSGRFDRLQTPNWITSDVENAKRSNWLMSSPVPCCSSTNAKADLRPDAGVYIRPEH